MTLELPDLTTLDPVTVAQNQSRAQERLAEYAPVLDARQGVLDDVVLSVHAVLASSLEALIKRFDQSRSLQAIEADPTLVDQEGLERALSNFRLTRRPGSVSSGLIDLTFTAPLGVVVPRGALFRTGVSSFRTQEAYTLRSSPQALLDPNDRLLEPVPGSTAGTTLYRASVPVVSEEVGSASRLRRGDRLIMSAPLVGLVEVRCRADFQGGLDLESNTALLARLQDGLAIRSPGNRMTLRALLRGQEELAAIQDVSVVGRGDPEQQRYHSLLPIADAGRIDVWIRPGPLPRLVRVTVTARFVGPQNGQSLYQATLGRDLAPGAYEVVGTLDPATGQALERVQTVFDFDTAAIPGVLLPELQSASEARFSRFQTLLVQCLWPVAPLAQDNPERELELVVSVPELVAEAQEFLAGREQVPPGGDLLVRAAVPAFLSVGITVYRAPGAEVDTAGLAQALATQVNASGFQSRVTLGDLAATAQNTLGPGHSIGRVDLLARLLRPDGSVRILSPWSQTQGPQGRAAGDTLEIPDEATAGLSVVSPRTAVWYLDPQAVAVQLLTRSP